VTGACVPTTQLLGHAGGSPSLLSHWRPALHEAQQPGVSLQQDIMGRWRTCELSINDITLVIMHLYYGTIFLVT